VKEVTRYQSEDGKEFVDKNECEKYDMLLSNCKRINDILKPKPEGCDFFNSGESIQQNIEDVKDFKRHIVQACSSYIDHQYVRDVANGERHISHLSRLVCDKQISPINRLFYRLECIDKNGKEYGQPYFNNNPMY
jgi:hypothetical protein